MIVADVSPRLLLGPGPSPVAPRVLKALARPTVGHLDPQFLSLMDQVNAGLRDLFGTTNEMTFPVSGTGSAAMEAALANVVESGDTVIVGINGVFGARLAEMARRMGCRVVPVEAEWGRIVDAGALIDALGAHPEARVVAVVLAETSTGVAQPLAEIGAAVRASGALFLVDAVTALGGSPVEVDANRIDICYAGTQKCLGVPPGLAPITFGERALERTRTRSTPCVNWYYDVTLLAEYLGEERKYHHTAPINMVYALHEGLRMVAEEGVDARYARHARVGRRLQEALIERGFTLFAQEGHRLAQLTSALLPDGLDEGPLRHRLLTEHGIEVGGGLGAARGKLWRIGLMGHGARDACVDRLLTAVDAVLP
jgi:alanine-glyoxylate transaminase/serine-glyoxylate transaminase/serine-pyruvate transaminase